MMIKVLAAPALLKKCLIDALDVGKVGQFIKHHPEVGLMGVANAQVFFFGATNPPGGGFENMNGWVYPAYLGLEFGIGWNAKLIVQSPQAVRRTVKTPCI